MVHDVSFTLEHGEILGLWGNQAVEKATLIKAAMGLLGSDGLSDKRRYPIYGSEYPGYTGEEKERSEVQELE